MLEILLTLLFNFQPDYSLAQISYQRACAVSEQQSHANLQGLLDGRGYTRGGENIALHYYQNNKTDFDILSDWLRSPSHAANLLGDFTHFSIGRCNNAVVLLVVR